MKGIIGVLDYVEGLEESLRAHVSALKPGGWTVFNVTITTIEGRIYALQELVGRRQINSRSPGEITALAEGVGLQVEKTAPAGLSRGGLTLVVGAARPVAPPDRFCYIWRRAGSKNVNPTKVPAGSVRRDRPHDSQHGPRHVGIATLAARKEGELTGQAASSSEPKNRERARTGLAEKLEERSAGVGDVFDKAFNSVELIRADEASAVGIYPYFKPVAAQHGGTVTVNDQEMIITGSNDYLGLTQDPRLKDAARAALDDYGTSCTGSRCLTGTLVLHEELERRLAGFSGAEAVLTFSTGFLGSLAVLGALTGRQDILYFDRENHASLYDGARLSFGTLRRYRHNDLDHLERLLAADAGKPGGRMIVTDGVFSMSGHIADLPGIVGLARKYGARVAVDDAHATGVLGENGRGTPEHFGLEKEIDLVIGTFSKSFASVGGFVSGPKAVVNYIKHKARPFIFTAALPAMQVAAVLKALDIMETEPWHREKLWQNVGQLQSGMRALGFDTLGSQTQIVPVLIGPDELAVAFWKALWEEGVFTTPAIPPGVPTGQSLIRTSVNANHTLEQVERLLEAFAAVGKHLGVIA